jgi:hypothetical protein
MPRKSGISLTVVPPALPGQRPVAPAELDDTERRVWEAITAALPLTWFDLAAQQVLVRACAQGAVCESLGSFVPSALRSRRTARRSVPWRRSTRLPPRASRSC